MRTGSNTIEHISVILHKIRELIVVYIIRTFSYSEVVVSDVLN